MRAKDEVLNGDRGQVVPLVVIVLMVAGAACWFTAELGARLIDRANAQTAADAAALAGAVEGDPAATELANANGATVDAFGIGGGVASVDVQVHGVTARASAEAMKPAETELGTGDREGLAPVMLAALDRADALLRRPVPVVSGRRSPSEQWSLWRNRAHNPFPVAPPGSSSHERGMAIDVPREFVPLLLSVAGSVGLCQPLAETDPIHFEPCPPTSPMS